MIPVTNSFMAEADIEVDNCMWECHLCPRTVRQYEDDDLWFSILSFYNGSWYEVMQMYICNEKECKEPPLTSIFKYIFYTDDKNKSCVRSPMVIELSEDPKITPQNVDEKLAIILTFS